MTLIPPWPPRYTVSEWTAPRFPQPPGVLLEQIRVLRDSPFSEPTLDALLGLYVLLHLVLRDWICLRLTLRHSPLPSHVESALFCHRAYSRLGAAMSVLPISLQNQLEIAGGITQDLSEWVFRKSDMQGGHQSWPSANGYSFDPVDHRTHEWLGRRQVCSQKHSVPPRQDGTGWLCPPRVQGGREAGFVGGCQSVCQERHRDRFVLSQIWFVSDHVDKFYASADILRRHRNQTLVAARLCSKLLGHDEK